MQIGLCCRNYQCILGSRNALRKPNAGEVVTVQMMHKYRHTYASFRRLC